MAHPLSQPCHSCGTPSPPDQFDLDLRIEYLTVTRSGGEPQTQVNIQISEVMGVYCSEPCWDAASEALAAALALTATYPPFAFVTSCCRCGSSVDRTKPYVCYSIAHMAYPETGGDFAICKTSRDWAVLCHACAESLDSEVGASIEQATPVREPT